jgi:hypothetical protein
MAGPTKADVKTASALEKVVNNLTRAVESLTKSTKDYGKTEKKVFKENLKDLDDVNDNLGDISRGVASLQGSLKKVKTKGVLNVAEASKYNDELKKINTEILRLHKMKPLSGAALKNQKKSLVKLQGEYDKIKTKIKSAEKNSQDWESSIGRSGPAFLKKWVNFRKAAEAGTAPLDDYNSMLGKAGTKLGSMPGLFKAAGGAAKGMGKILGGVSKAIAGWPMLIALAVKAVIDITRAADQFQKDANKAFATIRGPDIMGGDVKKQFKEFNNMIYKAGENIRVGLDVTQIRELLLAARDAGANITNLNKGLLTYRDAIYVASKASKTLGLELPMVGSIMGKMMVDLRMDLDRMDDAFVQIAFDAKKSGLSTDRFWATVQNASASLALYGVIVKSASNTMKAFTENMVGGADDAAVATENMYDVFKTGGLKAQLAIIQFARNAGQDVPAIFKEMAQEAAKSVEVVEGEIKLIEAKGKKKTPEDVEQLKRLRSELYAAQSKQSRFQKAAKGGDIAMAAEAGALAKRAPEMIISAIKGMVGPLHKLAGNQLEVAILGASKIGQSEKTVRMLVEIAKITEKRMTDLASKSGTYFNLSAKSAEETRNRLAEAIEQTAAKTGEEQLEASDKLAALLNSTLGMDKAQATTWAKMVRSDKNNAEEMAKIIKTGDGNMATQIAHLITTSRSIEKMTAAHFKDQEKTEGEMAEAADDTFQSIVDQTLSYNEMIKIAKDEVKWRLSSLRMFAKVNSGVWNILGFLTRNEPYQTKEQKRAEKALAFDNITFTETKDQNVRLQEIATYLKAGTKSAEELKTDFKEQTAHVSTLAAAQRGSSARALENRMIKLDDSIKSLKEKEKAETISDIEKFQLDALNESKSKLEELINKYTEGILFQKELVDNWDILPKKIDEATLTKDREKLAKYQKAQGEGLKRQKEILKKMDEKFKKNLPSMLKKAQETAGNTKGLLTKQEETNLNLKILNQEAAIASEIQKQMLLSTEEGRKRVREKLKGKKGEEVYRAAAAMGLGKDEEEFKSIVQEGVEKKEYSQAEARALMKSAKRGFEKVQATAEIKSHEEAYKTKRDFYDIVKGGLVNVQTGDILVDKDSFAQGTGGPPGAAVPAVTAVAGAAGTGAGVGTTINIKVVATEKDLAGKIANQIKKELYNRSISTSSYSLA